MFGSGKYSVNLPTITKLRILVCFQQPPPPFGCDDFYSLSLARITFLYWSHSCYVAAKKIAQKVHRLCMFQKAQIGGKRNEQDLISRTLNHGVHQQVCCVFAWASCDILVQRAARWLQGFERRRGGQGRIATSGTTQPLKRDLMLEWALTIGLESFWCMCFYVCGCEKKRKKERRQVSIESEVMKDRGV